jgi:hypothetical protein
MVIFGSGPDWDSYFLLASRYVSQLFRRTFIRMAMRRRKRRPLEAPDVVRRSLSRQRPAQHNSSSLSQGFTLRDIDLWMENGLVAYHRLLPDRIFMSAIPKLGKLDGFVELASSYASFIRVHR